MKFSKILGQEQLKNHLQNAIRQDRPAHAYIISGEADSGKMMLAEAFAAGLLCKTDGDDSCEECDSCKKAINHNHPDIIYVSHEKPNTISVDDIREQINDSIIIKPYESKYKIYIVDEAEKMNVQAQNALLKTIEEPPSYAIIILLTANAGAFLQTIRSRCVSLETKPVRRELIRDYLMREALVPDYQADMAAAFSQGNVGKAKSLATLGDFNELKDTVVNLTRRIPEMKAHDFYKEASEWKIEKEHVLEYLDLFQIWYRDVLLYKATSVSTNLIFQDETLHIKKQAEHMTYHGIEEVIKAIDDARAKLNANVSFETTIQQLLQTIKENYNG